MGKLLRELRPAALAAAPAGLAVLVFAAGVMLLVSGATPLEQSRLTWLVQRIPGELVNVSHFVSSLLGLVLVLLAWGLSRRLDAAWTWSLIVVSLAGVLALLKGVNWEETAALAVLVLLLAPARAAFDRHAALSRMEITPGWLVSASALVVGSGVLIAWSFERPDYADEMWWRLLTDGDVGRALRAEVGVGVLLIVIGLWRMIATPATPPVAGEDDPNFDRVRRILAGAEDAMPEAGLALLGDKRFLFSASGESFLMFGVRGRSWIAMGPPVGKASERAELFWRFRELADAHAARPGFYNITADDLPDVVDMGFAIQKIGECAVVPLADFSLEGTRRGNLRRAWRKLGEEGATFEVLPPERVGEVVAQLEGVSDAWLSGQPGAGDKAFSLGGFSRRYVREFPCAIVRWQGEVVAFANLWTTPDRRTVSIDLMRHTETAKRIMDYLFVEVLLWAREQGYATFEFGMAPLSGLADRPLAPVLSRLGNLVFERGEEFYNFQGVRQYKDKYGPVWQPRYIAAARKWAIPILLADVGLLSSGGVAGLAPRPKARPEKARNVAATHP